MSTALPQLQLKQNYPQSTKSSKNLLQRCGSMSFSNNENSRYSGNQTSKKYEMPKKLNYATTSVLSLGELEQIKQRSSIHDYKNNTQRAKHTTGVREERLMKDYEKKKQAQIDRFRVKEEQQRIIDKQEEKFREIQNQQVIKEANRKIFENNPHVRQFKTQLLYSDVIEEQEKLNNIKKQLNSDKKEMEEYLKEQEQRVRDSEDQKIFQEEEHRQRKKQLNKAMIDQQIQDFKKKAIEKYQNEQIEGQIIKDQAIELERKEKEKQLKIREKNKQLVLEMKKSLEDQKKLKAMEAQKNLLEDQKIEYDNQKKEKINQLKVERQKFMAEQVRKQRQTLIDEGTKKLKEFKSKEDERINKQIDEAQQKEEEKLIQKKARLDKLKQEIDVSLKQTIERKAREKEAEVQKDRQFSQALQKTYEDIDEASKKESIYLRQKEIETKKFQLQQIEQKRYKKKQEFIEDIDENEKLRSSLEMDKRVFNSWAETMVNQWQEDGKSLQPVIKNIHKIMDQA